MIFRLFLSGLFTFAFTLPALAAGADAPAIDGRHLGLAWMIPFAGILLSIAILPLVAPSFWHHHFGKVSAAWAVMIIVPFAVIHGVPSTRSSISCCSITSPSSCCCWRCSP